MSSHMRAGRSVIGYCGLLGGKLLANRRYTDLVEHGLLSDSQRRSWPQVRDPGAAVAEQEVQVVRLEYLFSAGNRPNFPRWEY